ncbi:hypothetical protein [Streptomyces luteogriseus]|uniref:hypothetical protein n=1 Tax=Streptomyces luteogriseus TaxID=68233 RepID=UPI002E2FDC4A|nr:hypothetical protein [Streptomyces luteogriseus]WTJ28891.1 hypothetical protein OID52_18400 [Streptomyces luteogriseus]
MAQYALFDSHNVVAAALLGFEAVLIPLINAKGVQMGWLVTSLVFLGLSIAILFLCLINRDKVAWPPCQRRLPERLDMEKLGVLYMAQPEEQTARTLFESERLLAEENDKYVIGPKRHTIEAALALLAAALIAYGIGAGTGHSTQDQPTKGTRHETKDSNQQNPACPSPPALPCPTGSSPSAHSTGSPAEETRAPTDEDGQGRRQGSPDESRRGVAEGSEDPRGHSK